jgi:dsRNA-specific ribonuclease
MEDVKTIIGDVFLPIDMFKRATTSEESNPNPNENYEDWEKKGDAVLKDKIIDILMEKGKHVVQINNDQQYYCKNVTLSNFYDFLFPNDDPKNQGYVKNKANIIEALIGALFFYDKDNGTDMCIIFIKYYKEYTDAQSKKDPKTDVDENSGLNNSINTFFDYIKEQTGEEPQIEYTIQEDGFYRCVIHFDHKYFIGVHMSKKYARKHACNKGCSVYGLQYLKI